MSVKDLQQMQMYTRKNLSTHQNKGNIKMLNI